MRGEPTEYRCTECKNVVTSDRPLTYCVCGGVFLTEELHDIIDEMFDGAFKEKK